MNQYQQIVCPSCDCTDLVKNGHDKNGTQRYRCKGCKKSFRLDYSYRAWEPGMKEKIDEQILNSSGVRDTARILKIDKNTVIAHLKKRNPRRNPCIDLIDFLFTPSGATPFLRPFW